MRFLERKNNIYKDLTNAFFSYELLLESNYASPTKYNWLSGKKVLMGLINLLERNIKSQKRESTLKPQQRGVKVIRKQTGHQKYRLGRQNPHKSYQHRHRTGHRVLNFY